MNPLISIELEKLRDEISELKQCQVNFIRFAALLYGITISAAGAYRGLQNSVGSIGNAAARISPVDAVIYAFFFSIVVLIYPSIMWIIIHKCRSIFRIVAYIRFIEAKLEAVDENGNLGNFLGYERLHRILKTHPWLKVRVLSHSSFWRALKKMEKGSYKFWNYIPIFKELKSYRSWSDIMDKEKPDFPEPRSVDGLKESGDYIGDYYGKLLFFLKLLFAVAWLPQLSLLIWAGTLFSMPWRVCAWLIAAASFMWWLYHHMIFSRYMMELRYRPFSMDAFYDMWRWAEAEGNRE